MSHDNYSDSDHSILQQQSLMTFSFADVCNISTVLSLALLLLSLTQCSLQTADIGFASPLKSTPCLTIERADTEPMVIISLSTVILLIRCPSS